MRATPGQHHHQFPAELVEAEERCPPLEHLDLGTNRIAAIPETIVRLGSTLVFLDVSNNDVAAVPPVVGRMGPGLRTLVLEGNPIRNPLRRVMEKGTPAVLAYLLDRIPQQQGVVARQRELQRHASPQD